MQDRRTVIAVSAATAALIVVLLTPAFATAAPLPSGTPVNTAQWAYGGQRWVNVSATLPNGTFSESVFFGWHVIFSSTNTSATTVAIEAQRVMAADVFINYCSPTCTSPVRSGNVSIVGWERDVGFANLTSAATVYENGVAAPAVGLLNASAQSASRLNQSYAFSQSLGAISHSASASLVMAGSASASSSFSPALGLVPLNLSANLTWNSTSNYTAQAAWSGSFGYALHGPAGGNLSGSGTPGGNITGGGIVSLNGADLGSVTLRNGQTAPVIAIQVFGPFDDLDGVILIPHGYNAFGGAAHAWDTHEVGGATIGTSRLDAFVDGSRHLHLVAAASTYLTANHMLTVPGAPSPGDGRVSADAAPAASAGTLVQAQPESVAQASQGQHCLSVGCATGPSGPGSVGTVIVLVGLIAVLVVGSIAVVQWRVRAGARAQLSGAGSVPSGALQGAPANLPPP
ncbi:MAG: hypothetical protein ACHQ2Y_07110, partial [Candidatus Lutacidiplasmatales archaeon]